MAKIKARQVHTDGQDELDHEPEAPDVEGENQDRGEEFPAETDGRGVDTSNKASLVRAALVRGFTKPREGCRWIRETYGVEIEGTYFSVAKSQQAKRGGESPAARSSPSAQPSRGAMFPPIQGVPAGFGADVKVIRVLLANHNHEADALKDLIVTVDTLVRKYGVSGLNEMIEAFSQS